MNKNILQEVIELERDARAYGFDWTDADMIIDQAISEAEEIREAIRDQEPAERIQEEIGDLIYAAVSLCLYSGFDAEETIAMVTKKFSRRMAAMKELTKQHGLQDLRGQSMEFMLGLWKQVKAQEHY